MRPSYYPILRIVLTLIAGVAMILFPGEILSYIAILLGFLLIIPGAIQLIRYGVVRFKRNRRDRRYHPMKFPFIALLAVIAGVAIVVLSHELVGIFSILLASALIFVGGYEILALIRTKNKLKVAVYLLPTLLILLGIFILVNPLHLIPSMIVIMFGVGAIIYSINEVVYLLMKD